MVFLVVPCHGSGRQQQEIPPLTTELSTQVNESPVTQNDLIFLGVSPRFSNRDISIQTALKDAARRFSFFHSVSGSVVRHEQIGGGVFNFHVDRSYTLQYDDELEKFIEQLEYDPLVDIFENSNAVFIVTRVVSNVSMPQHHGHSFGSERPQWIDSPPASVGGFIASVGHSGRLSSHADTVIRSYENALTGIIENIVVQVNSEQQNYVNNYSAFGFDINLSSEFSASCTLTNFYVIESWTDPVNLSVWTLAVAKSGL